MREIGFGGRARDVELGDDGADRFERAARLFDRRFELVGAAAQRRRPPRRPSSRSSRSASSARTSASSCALPADDRRAQLLDAPPRLVELAGERGGALFELGAGFLEPLHFDRQRAARSTSAACAAPASAARRLSSSAASRASNSRRCATVSRSSAARCVVFEPRDRRARFVLAAVERVALLFGLALLARELLALLRQPRLPRRSRAAAARRSRRPPFPACGARRCSAAIAFDACAIVASSSAVSCASRASASRSAGDPLAQLLDLALGLENAARFVAAAAGDEVRSAEHVARRASRPAAASSRLASAAPSYDSAIQASPIACRIARGERPVDAHDRRQRDHAVGRGSRAGVRSAASPVRHRAGSRTRRRSPLR